MSALRVSLVSISAQLIIPAFHVPKIVFLVIALFALTAEVALFLLVMDAEAVSSHVRLARHPISRHARHAIQVYSS